MAKKLPDKFARREMVLENMLLLFTAAVGALCNRMKPVWGEKAEIAITVLFAAAAYFFIAPLVGNFMEDGRRKRRRKRRRKLKRPAPRVRDKKASAVLNSKLS